MALRQRPAARFFAAFYRWSCYTQRTPCIHPTRHDQTASPRYSTLRSTRSYFSTAQNRQDEGSQVQPEVGEQPEKDINGPVQSEEVVIRKVAPGEKPAKHETKLLQDGLLPDYTMAQIGAAAMGEVVRGLMRHVPSSVAIITATHIDPELEKRVPLGIAVSSFNTVTLDPPHVSFNIRYPSKTLDAIRDAKGRFRVHLLSGDKKSSQIVETFARGNNPKAYKLRQRVVPLFLPSNRDLPHATESVAPQIRGPTVIAALECELTQEVVVADHVIAVAKVNSLATKDKLVGTLLYHEGVYKRANGTVLQGHQDASKPDPRMSDDVGVYWKYDLFPGKVEREDLVQRMKAFFKQHPRILEMQPKLARRELQRSLGLPAAAFGINLLQLIQECKVDSGLSMDPHSDSPSGPLLFDFHGRLSPDDIVTIANRARKLVLADPIALSLGYQFLFTQLSFSMFSHGLLASDILQPLRADGIVAPFEQDAHVRIENPNFEPTIEDLEIVEFKLLEFIKTKTYDEVYKMTDEELRQAIEESEWATSWIWRVRTRLTVEAFPDIFNAPHIDLKGQLTPEEVRVFVNRAIQFVAVENNQVMKKHISMPKVELLRRIGVHPLISGVDSDFLFGKLSFLTFQTNNYRELPEAVDQMLKRMFVKKTFTWEDLETRVRELVQRNTLHATRWSREDILAAMGIDQRAKLKTPFSENKPHINRSHVVPILVAKALRNHYGKGTPEENDAIKAFLKSQYNYDVVGPSAPPSPDDSRGSDEEMFEAM
ncbi:hypothetical protein K458DRAFT_262014, partial [Lentithecium fluviatile CBS 122367]